MKFQRVVLPLLVVLLAFLLSACGTNTLAQGFPGLVFQDGTIYLTEGRHVYAVTASTGQEVRMGDAPLRFPAEADANINLYAPVALTDDGQIIFPNSHPSQHQLYSIDPETGNVRWTFEKSKGTWIGGALSLGTDVYAPGGDGILYALDASGNSRWTAELSKSGLWTHPVSDGKLIFQATMDGMLFALDPADGRQVWQLNLDSPILGAPAVAEDGTLYLGTLSGILYAVDGASGSVSWQQQLEGSIWGTPALSAENVYIGTLVKHAGKFYAIQRDNGAIQWQRDDEGSIIAGPLALEDQVLYVTELGRVQALTSDGSPKWQADLKGKLVSTPVLAGDVIVVAPLMGETMLAAYDLNGAQRWTFKAE